MRVAWAETFEKPRNDHPDGISVDFGGMTWGTTLPDYVVTGIGHQRFWGNGALEAQFYDRSALDVRPDTGLRIWASPIPRAGKPWTAGMIQNHRSGLGITYGAVESLVRMSPGTGGWPALWMFPMTWDSTRQVEHDIFEKFPAHSGFVEVSSHLPGSTVYLSPVRLDVGAWHLYRIEMGPGITTWYVDDQMVAQTLTSADVPMHVIANVAVMTGFSGSTPSWMDVRSITGYTA